MNYLQQEEQINFGDSFASIVVVLIGCTPSGGPFVGCTALNLK